MSAVPHLPNEDPDEPEPTSDAGEEEVDAEVDESVTLVAGHDCSLERVII